MGASNPLTVAVVGCGQWGAKVVSCFFRLGVLAAVVDGDAEQAQRIAGSYDVPALDWDTVLDDYTISAVALATPANQHAKMILQALHAGKHVYVEKPLTLSSSEAGIVATAVAKSGKTLLVGHILQYHPAFLALKSLVRQGKIGRLLLIRSTRFGPGRVRHDENALWCLAPHDASMILGLAAQEPTSVEAHASAVLRTEIADTVDARLEFPSGLVAQIAVSWLHPHKERNIVVTGDHGTLVFDDGKPWESKLMLFTNKVVWSKGHPSLVEGVAEAVSIEEREPLLEQGRHFVECIRTGNRPVTDVWEGVSVVRVLDAVTQATRTPGRTTLLEVTVPAQMKPTGATIDLEAQQEQPCGRNGTAPKEDKGLACQEIPTSSVALIDKTAQTSATGGQNGTAHSETEVTTPAKAESIRSMVAVIDLKAQQERIKASLDERIARVLREGQYILGPEVTELEQELRSYMGGVHAIACASGTDALTLAFLALDLRPGDAVLVPAFTFVGTIEPIVLLGAIPIFVDVDPETLCIDANAIAKGVEAAEKAQCRPVGIAAVDLFGYPADYQQLHSVASRMNLWVVADAAQSFGASASGRCVGNLATLTTTSFFPAKPLGCYGDGGAVFTTDSQLATKIRSIHQHGKGEHKYDHARFGLNSRLDTLQAAVLLSKLEVFPDELEARQEVAARYASLLGGVVRLPYEEAGVRSAWATYTIRLQDRDALQEHLSRMGIATAVHYPKPVHRQTAYQHFPTMAGGCPVAERAAAEVISLPMHPYLEGGTQQRIAEAVRRFVL